MILICLCLISCGQKTEPRPLFSIFPDENYSPQEAWAVSDTVIEDKNQFNPGITRNQWWLGMTFTNPSDSTRQFLFVPNNPHINRINVFENNASTPSMELGDFLPFKQRPFLDRDLVIPITISAGSTKRYLILLDKVGETFHVDPEVFDFETFHQRRS